MPSTKEIRAKISSVQNTRKITKAMEMVAASKMKKAQDRMRAARPYGDAVRNLIGHLAEATSETTSPYLRKVDKVERIGLICVSTDKGLAGALNTNIQRLLAQRLREWTVEGKQVEATALGNKGLGFLQRVGVPVVSQAIQLGDRPQLERLLGAIKVQLEAFQEGKVDVVYIAYSRFINAMKQEPVIEQLLPLPKSAVQADEVKSLSWDYIYEPNAEEVLKVLLRRYIEAIVYQAVAENMASEQSARMVAMKAASDNAKKLIDELQLVYNKTRQAGITTELTEIVGGAAAVS
ncbi:MAG: F0F1 ATP synthase subunit gamma [Burkholderiaceae bacterium]|nr:F0F1 ATP synthase subunit gamma [Burkholderiaceae bacterium]